MSKSMLAELPPRLRSKIGSTESCWVWNGSVSSDGYGSVKEEGRALGAHRVVYRAVRGPIPQGLELDHLRRNRACVNPAHLEPVTRAENMARWARTITHCPQGHPYDGQNVIARVRPNGWKTRDCRICKNEANRAYRARRAAMTYKAAEVTR